MSTTDYAPTAERPTDTRELSNAERRKQTPIATGVIDYFPLAIQELARVSWQGNQQHHADKPLHWDRSKSSDEDDALMRHFIDRGKLDTDGMRHTAKVAWRALAMLEKELEAALTAEAPIKADGTRLRSKHYYKPVPDMQGEDFNG